MQHSNNILLNVNAIQMEDPNVPYKYLLIGDTLKRPNTFNFEYYYTS